MGTFQRGLQVADYMHQEAKTQFFLKVRVPLFNQGSRVGEGESLSAYCLPFPQV